MRTTVGTPPAGSQTAGRAHDNHIDPGTKSAAEKFKARTLLHFEVRRPPEKWLALLLV